MATRTVKWTGEGSQPPRMGWERVAALGLMSASTRLALRVDGTDAAFMTAT